MNITKITSFEELERMIAVYRNQQWEVCSDFERFGVARINLHPEMHFLGLFDRYVSSVELQDGRGNYVYHIFSISQYKIAPDLAKMHAEIRPVSDDKPVSEKQIWDLIDSVCSEEFKRSENLSEESVIQRLQDLNDYFSGKKEAPEDMAFPVFRLSETRNDFRILLVVNPTNHDIKLAFTSPESKGMCNSFMGIIYNLFSEVNLKRDFRQDFIHFGQQNKEFPVSDPGLKFNLKQGFTFEFNLNSRETRFERFVDNSARRQMKTGDEVLRICHLLYGVDMLGHESIREGAEKKQYELGKGINSYLELGRFYAEPEFDLSIELYMITDESGGSAPYFGMRMEYNPCVTDNARVLGWVPHYLAEDLTK